MIRTDVGTQFSLGRLATTCLLAVAMTACGGGGGGGETNTGGTNPTPPSPEPELERITETDTLTIGESASVSENVRGDIQSIRKIRGDNTIGVTQNRSAVTFTVEELVNEAEARFEVVTQDANTIITYFFTIEGVNTSAIETVEMAETLADLPATTTALQDDQRLTEIVLEVQYLANELSSDEKDEASQAIATAFEDIGGLSQDDLDALANTLRNYKQGTATENDLVTAVNDADQTLTQIGAVGEATLEQYQTVLRDLGVTLPDDLASELPITFDTQLGRYTRFTNPLLGSYTDGQWTFNPEFDFLNSALTITQNTATGTLANN